MKEQFTAKTNAAQNRTGNMTRPTEAAETMKAAEAYAGRKGPHILPVRACIWVWAGLMALTAVTVGIAGVDLGFPHVLAAMIVATAKAGLVVFWFMHIKYEGAAIRWMLFSAFLILAIFISFTFFDVAYR